MEITRSLLPKSKYSLKAPYSMKPEYITVHNTANDASAINEIAYMIRNNKFVSYHFAVDDKRVVQGLPLNRNGWHCGDGSRGTGNRKSIGVEICYSRSGGVRFRQAEQNAAELVAYLLDKYGLDISRVKKHQDWSGKYCPHRTLDKGWNRFLELVKRSQQKKEVDMVANKDYVKRVYNVVLQRNPDSGGLNYYTGKDAGYVFNHIAKSEEAQKVRAREKRQDEIRAEQSETIRELEKTVTALSSRPTKEEFEIAVKKQQELTKRVQNLQDELENASKPIIREPETKSEQQLLINAVERIVQWFRNLLKR